MHYMYKIYKIDIFNYIYVYIYIYITQVSLKSDQNTRHFT
jgi:hypothetical protein